MIGKRLISQTPLTLAEVKELIESRKKEGELSYEQNLTLENCIQFSRLSVKEAKELIDELMGLEKIDRKQAVMLTYLLPRNADEVKIIFSKEHFILTDEEINQILEILKKYIKEPEIKKEKKKASKKKKED